MIGRLSACLGMILAASAQAGTPIFVDGDAPGAQDGSSWGNAYHSLTQALAVAGPGDELRVAAGAYRPEGAGSTWDLTFAVPAGVVLRGSFDGFGSPTPNAQDLVGLTTLLDADHAQDDVPFDVFVNRFDNSDHLVTLGAGLDPVRIEGFRLRGGDATGPGQKGGAIQLLGGALTLADCRVEDSRAWHQGGGLYASPGSQLTIERCQFTGNVVGDAGDLSSAGGGLTAEDTVTVIENSTFTDNHGYQVNFPFAVGGGAVSIDNQGLVGSPTRIERCHFEGNTASEAGGALMTGGDVDVVDCDFVDNRVGPGLPPFSSANGGALCNGPGQLNLLRSRFLGNAIITGGGQGGAGSALCLAGNATVTQCEIVGNGRPDQNAEAIMLLGGDGVIIEGCTIAHNVAAGISSARPAGLNIYSLSANSVVANSVLYGNVSAAPTLEQQQLQSADRTAQFFNNLVEGWSGTLPGSGGVGGDPLFMDADGSDDVAGTLDDDLRLSAGSPAIDAGRADLLPADVADLDCDGDLAEPLPYDLVGHERQVDDPATVDTGSGSPALDMGSHEFGAGLPTEIWVDLGGGSPGALGQPLLVGSGSFCEGQNVALHLSNAPPGELVLLMEALSSTPVPKWGGTVFTVPIFAQFLLSTNGAGELPIEVPLVGALPPGLEVYYQYLVRDTSVSPAIILSNAVHAVTP
jgi:hypothetical protein